MPSWTLGAALLVVALAALARAACVTVVVRRMASLGARAAPDPARRLPTISVVCAGRDEAAHLESAVRSWLAQDVPGLQVVVVDDRSADGSFSILARLAAEDPRVVALRVERRPDDWLGKCHALQVGASAATGDFILFTDADVHLAPGALARTLAACEDERADHLVLLPDVLTDGALQRALTIFFFHELLLLAGGLSINRDDGRCFLGVGAFNLVRRAAYESVGGHAPIRLQVGDDVALARLLGRAGFRARVYDGRSLASVRWQRGVLGTIRGLEKNAFWGVRLSLAWTSAATLALLAGIAPLLVPVLASPLGLPGGHSALAWCATAVWALAITLPHAARRSPGWWLDALLHPLAVGLLVATLWNSCVRVLARGGISWRGDFLPLPVLRAGLLPLSWWRGRAEVQHGRSDSTHQ